MVIVAGLAAVGCGDGSSEAPGAGSGGDAATGGSGGGTGGSTGGSVATGAAPGSGGDEASGGSSAEEFPGLVAEATCSVRVACCASVGRTLDEARCREHVFEVFVQRVTDPLTVYDSSRAAACLELWGIAGEGCLQRDIAEAARRCEFAAAGTVPDEGVCTAEHQCAEPEAGYAYWGDVTMDGNSYSHQMVDLALGEICGGDRYCAEGTYSASSGVCEPRKADGAACCGSVECSGPCVDGRCAPLEADGDAAKLPPAECDDEFPR